jgi:hypothetical protein
MAKRRNIDIRLALQVLENAPTPALRQQWQARFGAPAPQLRREVLIFALGHALQELHLGRLSKRSHQRLQQGADTTAGGTTLTALPAGTRLVREWRGRTHAVDVHSDGYVWEGQQFKSLSAIARAITGTRWSGPRFFGTEANSSISADTSA